MIVSTRVLGLGHNKNIEEGRVLYFNLIMVANNGSSIFIKKKR